VSSATIYELGEVLGQGSNGTVFMATRRDSSGSIRQSVAVKILNSKKSVDIWRREFESLSRVHSKYCVRVFGFEWLQDQPALILELINGVTLADLARFSEFDGQDLNCVGAQVVAGLKDLKAQGMCHGDLSPNNILIDTRGGVKLVDFGFGNTSTGRRKVTVEFAAPEILAGGEATEQTDLWSLGQILKYMGASESLARRLVNLPPECATAAAKRDLGRKVRALREMRRKLKTSTLDLVKTTGAATRVAAAAMAAVTLFGMSSSVRGMASPPNLAQIMIRSQFGVEIEWRGRAVGYAPLDIRDIEPGTYVLRWKNRSRSGQRTLTLRGGDSIVIDDKTFTDPATGGASFDRVGRTYTGNYPRTD
jgi:serine/threonine protein kinase